MGRVTRQVTLRMVQHARESSRKVERRSVDQVPGTRSEAGLYVAKLSLICRQALC